MYSLVGLASKDSVKLDELARKFNCRPYSNYEDLISDSTIDCVYIPLPNALHFHWAKLALEANKHVIVEKPFCPLFSEVSELVELAADRRCVVFENFQYRFHTQMGTIKKLISENVIGAVKGISTTFAFPPFANETNIRYQVQLAGGSLMDAGCYPLSLATELLGDDLNVVRSNLYFADQFQVDIGGAGYLESADSSRFAFVKFGFHDPYECSLEVVGTKGRIISSRIFTAPTDLSVNVSVRTVTEEYRVMEFQQNQFTNMLKYFRTLTFNQQQAAKERQVILSQARLLDQFKKTAKEMRL